MLRSLLVAIGLIMAAVPAYAADDAFVRTCEMNQNICNDDLFGEGDLREEPRVLRCMNNLLYCRQYSQLILRLNKALDKGQLPAIQRYFMGAAYYRLSIINRSEGIRCSLQSQAKYFLEDFLNHVQTEYYEKTLGYGTVGLGYIRDANNMMKVLQQPSSCPESGLLPFMVEGVALKYSKAKIEDLFLNVRINNPDAATNPVQDAMNLVFSKLQGMTTKIAGISTTIRLLETEMIANQNRLNKIRSIMGTLFAGIGAEGPIPAAPTHSQLRKDADVKLASIVQASTKVSEARMNGVASINQLSLDSGLMTQEELDKGADPYRKLRVYYSSQANLWRAEANFQTNLMKFLTDEEIKLKAVVQGASVGMGTQNPMTGLDIVKKKFKATLPAACNSTKPWYCF